MIPKANLKNLMLKNEVLDAVHKQKFHIYQVANVTEGIEILTGLPAGIADEAGGYPPETVYGRIQKKLKTFLERARELKQAGSEHLSDA
jgi:predicted ATP-dependent protease